MTPTTPERWLPVVGYEGLYEVSDLGRVRSLNRLVPCRGGKQAVRRGRILRQHIAKRTGRPNVSLARDGVHATTVVATIVLTAFGGPRPEGQVGCHNDGDPTNNCLSNLRWDTQSENIRDCVAQGTHDFTRRTHCPRGHLLAPWNISAAHARRGHRTCLACNRALSEKRRARLRGEPFDMQQVSDDYFTRIIMAA